MEFNTAATIAFWILTFFVAIMAIVMVGMLFALVVGLNKLNQKIDTTVLQVRPLITKSTEVLDTVQRVTMNVGDRADQILARGEELTDNLATKIDHTATVVEKTVTDPLINVSSILAGVTKGFSAFNRGFKSNGSR